MSKILPAAPEGRQFLIWAAALAVSCLLQAGCQHLDGPSSTAPRRPSDLDAARTAFLNREYGAARQAFQRTMARTDIPGDLISAEYGLACVDMVTAGDEASFLAGLDRLLRHPGHDYRKENPELLVRALGHGIVLIRAAELRAGAEAEQYRARTDRQRKEIKKLENRVRTLEHQISVLENIDQELQEKRNVQ